MYKRYKPLKDDKLETRMSKIKSQKERESSHDNNLSRKDYIPKSLESVHFNGKRIRVIKKIYEKN